MKRNQGFNYSSPLPAKRERWGGGQRSGIYFGYDEEGDEGLLKIASPEKALLDIFYLSQTKTRLFKTLPEVELPRNFKISIANEMIAKITSIRKKTLVQRGFSDFIERFR